MQLNDYTILERQDLKIKHASQWIDWPGLLQTNYGFNTSEPQNSNYENKFQWRFQCSEVSTKQTKRRRSNFVELSPLCIFIVVTLGLWYNPMLVFVSGDCIPLL